MTPEQTTVDPGGEPVSEGASQGETVSEVADSAEADVGEGLENALKGSGEEAAETFGKKASGLLGKAGVLGSAALGGYDLYEDIKSGKIQGNNDWEKASNILQIGGSLADIAGTFFPPAKLIGGVLDIASGVTDSVGEKVEEDKTSDDLKQEQTEETETDVTGASLEQKDPRLTATGGLTAVTGRVQ